MVMSCAVYVRPDARRRRRNQTRSKAQLLAGEAGNRALAGWRNDTSAAPAYVNVRVSQAVVWWFARSRDGVATVSCTALETHHEDPESRQYCLWRCWYGYDVIGVVVVAEVGRSGSELGSTGQELLARSSGISRGRHLHGRRCGLKRARGDGDGDGDGVVVAGRSEF